MARIETSCVTCKCSVCHRRYMPQIPSGKDCIMLLASPLTKPVSLLIYLEPSNGQEAHHICRSYSLKDPTTKF